MLLINVGRQTRRKEQNLGGQNGPSPKVHFLALFTASNHNKTFNGHIMIRKRAYNSILSSIPYTLHYRLKKL